MKLIERISCFAAAAVMMLTAGLTAFAEEEEAEEYKYTEDESMVTEDDSAPTLSFDTSDFEDYIHLTKDASKINLNITTDNKTAYQGQSIILSASAKEDITDWHQFAWLIRDDDKNVMYPEAEEIANKENEEGKSSGKFLVCGVELHAEDFGLSYFDGGMLTFTYRINPNVDQMLMGNSVYIYCEKEDGTRTGKEVQLKYNDTDANNTTQWANGVLPIGANIGAKKIIITVPLQRAMEKDEVLYLDNMNFTTQTGKNVVNVDRYNANAKKTETVQGIQIKKHNQEITFTGSDSKTTKSKVKNVLAIIGIVIISAAVITGIVFLSLKRRKKFY